MLGGWVCNVLDSAIVISLIPLPRHEINHMKTAIDDIDDDLEEVTLDEAGEQDIDFVAREIFGEEDHEGQARKRKRRALNTEKKTKSLQDMPEDWQHLRHSVWSVREAYYRAVDLMISKYHMSYDQAVAAVVTVGRIMTFTM